MKQYLSYGAGVGSTALLCHMLDAIRSGGVEVVFCDHGTDWPKLMSMQIISKMFWKFKSLFLKVKINDSVGLYNYYYNHNAIPMYRYKICTDKGKIRPFNKYVKMPCEVFGGITWDERKRARPNKLKKVVNFYPLVEERIARDRAIKIIENTENNTGHMENKNRGKKSS